MWGYNYAEDERTKTVKRKDEWKVVRSLSSLASEFVECLAALDALVPSGNELRMMREQIARVAEGQPLTLTSVICPDYATGDVDGRRCYTFDRLGSGVGLVAGRALEVHTKLLELFRQKGVLTVSSELVMADQEATEENCHRVGLSQTEFLDHLRQSQEVLKLKAGESGVSVSTPLLTELDSASWQRATEEAKTLIQDIPPGQVNAVRQVRSRFLEKWAGRRLSDAEVMEMVLSQGREYLTVGRHLARPERLILGLDAPPMALFLRRGTRDVTPVVYFRRPEY